MKKILAVTLALVMVFALAAPLASAADGSVYLLNFKPEFDESAQKLAAMYTEKTGVPVKVVTAASGSYSQTLTSEMDKSAAPTLFIIGNQAGVKEWGEFAMDLNGTAIADELNTDLYNLYDEDGRLVSIPYAIECYGIIVNPDLIEAAGHSMDELVNFAGLKAVAEDIHARAAELGFDAFATQDMDGSQSWRITGHLINLEYVYEERAAGERWEVCPATLTGDYMENFKSIYTLIINNGATDPKELATGGHDGINEFASAKAAFYLTGSWDFVTVKDTVPNATMIPYYCGVEGEEMAGLNCGTENCWAINDMASEADKQATMDFWVWLETDPEALAICVEQLGPVPYKASPLESANNFLNAAAAYTDKGCYVFDWATNYQPNVDDYRAALVSALNAYNADQSDANWAQVVTAAIDGWAVQYAAANG